MKNWIYCWELGAGIGHLTRMKAVSTALENHGVRVSWCVQASEAVTARSFWPRVLTAPVSSLSSNSVTAPGSMAEILQNEGWSQVDVVGTRIRQWQQIFRDAAADRILLDYAPNALLAGLTDGRRVDVLGTGFYIPPRRAPLPTMRSDHGVYHDRLQWAESQIVSTLNDLNGINISNLRDIFHHPNVRNHLLTYPELDHYGARDNVHYSGIVTGFSGDSPDWPDDQEGGIFAYLKPFPQLPYLLQLINQMGVRLLVHGNEKVGALITQMGLKDVQFCPQPVDERSIAKGGYVMINHAGHDGTAKATRAGIALWQLPLNIEQAITARNARKMGVADWLLAGQIEGYASGLEQLLAEQSIRSGAGVNWARPLRSPEQNMQHLLADLDISCH